MKKVVLSILVAMALVVTVTNVQVEKEAIINDPFGASQAL